MIQVHGSLAKEPNSFESALNVYQKSRNVYPKSRNVYQKSRNVYLWRLDDTSPWLSSKSDLHACGSFPRKKFPENIGYFPKQNMALLQKREWSSYPIFFFLLSLCRVCRGLPSRIPHLRDRIHTTMHTHTHTHTYMCTLSCTHTHTHMHLYLHVHTHVHAFTHQQYTTSQGTHIHTDTHIHTQIHTDT